MIGRYGNPYGLQIGVGSSSFSLTGGGGGGASSAPSSGGGMGGGGGAGGGAMAIVGGALELGSSIANAVAVGKQSRSSLQETLIASQSAERVAALQAQAAASAAQGQAWAARAAADAGRAASGVPTWVYAVGGLAWWVLK